VQARCPRCHTRDVSGRHYSPEQCKQAPLLRVALQETRSWMNNENVQGQPGQASVTNIQTDRVHPMDPSSLPFSKERAKVFTSPSSAWVSHHKLRTHRHCSDHAEHHTTQTRLGKSATHVHGEEKHTFQDATQAFAAHAHHSSGWPHPPATLEPLRSSPIHRCRSLTPICHVQCSARSAHAHDIDLVPPIRSQLQKSKQTAHMPRIRHKNAATSASSKVRAHTAHGCISSLSGPQGPPNTKSTKTQSKSSQFLHLDNSGYRARHFSRPRVVSLPRRWQSLPAAPPACNSLKQQSRCKTTDTKGQHFTKLGIEQSRPFEQAGGKPSAGAVGLPHLSCTNLQASVTPGSGDRPNQGQKDADIDQRGWVGRQVGETARGLGVDFKRATRLSQASALAVPLFHIRPQETDQLQMLHANNQEEQGALSAARWSMGQVQKNMEIWRIHKGSAGCLESGCGASDTTHCVRESGSCSSHTGGPGMKDCAAHDMFTGKHTVTNMGEAVKGRPCVNAGCLFGFGQGVAGLVWVPSSAACHVFATSLQEVVTNSSL
jgi:hypothetical protein